ncbi:MAG: 2-oxoacid:acceptor oxidoreductase family protein [Gammaproteobacteria bacterium]|nr:2-oxoacid:acceptor oxidoreductase family protein [Gammaproteobacteria bacterium]
MNESLESRAKNDAKEKEPAAAAQRFHEIRFHGRGGQGAVSVAALLALAEFDDGFEAQAFPKFGSERRGAPVMECVVG